MGLFPSLSPAGTLALGIIVGLLSTCVQSVGLTLQRKSHMLEDEKPFASTRRPAYRRRRWQIGMLLFLLANIIGSTIQITTLPLPLLSTLQASGLVFNSILAGLLLHEAWTMRTVYGTVLVAAGAVLISLFSALPEPSHNLEQLLDLLKERGFMVWFVLSLVFVLGLLVLDFVMRRVVPASRRDSPRLQLLRGMSYGCVSGILAAHALLLAKSAVELIVRSIADKHNQFARPASWVLVIAFVVLALSQLYYLHLGLRLISTSILYPFVFCVYNIVAILDGLIYFRQMDRLPPLHAGLIALGTVVLLAGVLALSWRLQDEEVVDEDGEHRKVHMKQHEIPQTVLTPGLGFVGEPSSESSEEGSESAIADDEDDYADEDDEAEQRPLVKHSSFKGRLSRNSRSSAKTSGTIGQRKRKRAATLREVIDIWEEQGEGDDDEVPRYGTFQHSASNPDISRPQSADQQRRTRRRRSDLEGADGAEDGPGQNVRRAGTMPASSAVGDRSQSGRRRRSTTLHAGHGHAHGGDGALFSDLLKLEWWKGKKDATIDPKDRDGEGS